MLTHLSPPSRFDLELDSGLSSDSKKYIVAMDYGLKSGWCEKHKNIKKINQ